MDGVGDSETRCKDPLQTTGLPFNWAQPLYQVTAVLKVSTQQFRRTPAVQHSAVKQLLKHITVKPTSEVEHIEDNR